MVATHAATPQATHHGVPSKEGLVPEVMERPRGVIGAWTMKVMDGEASLQSVSVRGVSGRGGWVGGLRVGRVGGGGGGGGGEGGKEGAGSEAGTRSPTYGDNGVVVAHDTGTLKGTLAQNLG